MELNELIIYIIHCELYIPIIKVLSIKTTIFHIKIQQNIKKKQNVHPFIN